MTRYVYTGKNLIVNKKIGNTVNIANTENTVNIALVFIRITAATNGLGGKEGKSFINHNAWTDITSH